MSETLQKTFRGQVLMVAGVVMALFLGVVLVAAPGCRGKGGGAAVTKIPYYCDECGAEWEAEPGPEPKCPECGKPGVTKSWYQCPRCKKAFCGVESRKLGPGSHQYRVPGTKEWQARPPKQLTCPNCKYSHARIYKSPVNPDGTPITGTGEKWAE